MAKKENHKDLPTNSQIVKFKMLYPMLNSMLVEMREFSKKKQDGVLNELKVKMINKVLEQIQDLLIARSAKEFLDLLDIDVLPTNSDAVLVLTNYKTAMTGFKREFYKKDRNSYDFRWYTQENP